jgi:glycosidase
MVSLLLSYGRVKQRAIIYQLFVRLFGNINESNVFHGTIEENGCGTFADINDAALESLSEMGFNTIWLTGVLEQASGTSYEGRAADHANLLKGKAGSPYAIRDAFDVCPDYAVDPSRRLEEFRALLQRCKAHQLRVLIDFVPNHVARSYASDVKPELSFGQDDDVTKFFHRDNNFYYLQPGDEGGSPPLRLPTSELDGGDGLFPPESEYGKVTGNNVISWAPSVHDWYETVKLNYGHDFTQGRNTSHLSRADAAVAEVPKTWRMMDEVIAYWQDMGVDGFRVDMAHMIPMEFWHWLVKRARGRHADVFFMAEAYDNDPAKLTDGHVLDELLAAGFDAVYDDPSYDVLMGVYDGVNWCNDLDALTFTGERFHRSLRYGENHDEVRLATAKEWAATGMRVGRPVCATLFCMGRGPVMIYNGQEVGEPAEGQEGFGGDDGRTTIFDYWCMSEFAKWVNGHAYDGGRLSEQQRDLRAWYSKLLLMLREPAFAAGDFYGLNYANRGNAAFGRLAGEVASGHWLYAFLRRDEMTRDAFLCIVNFHPTEDLRDVNVVVPEHATNWLAAGEVVVFHDWWNGGVDRLISSATLRRDGLWIAKIAACSAVFLRIGICP